MITLNLPMWVVSLVTSRDRAMYGLIIPLAGNFGYAQSAFIGAGFSYYHGGADSIWRAPVAIQCPPCLILLAGMRWLPESPRFLLLKDRSEEAWKIVHDLHSNSMDPEHEFAKMEFFQMRKQLELDRTLKSSAWELLVRPSYRRRVVMTIGLVLTLWSSGVLVIGSMYWRLPPQVLH